MRVDLSTVLCTQRNIQTAVSTSDNRSLMFYLNLTQLVQIIFRINYNNRTNLWILSLFLLSSQLFEFFNYLLLYILFCSIAAVSCFFKQTLYNLSFSFSRLWHFTCRTSLKRCLLVILSLCICSASVFTGLVFLWLLPLFLVISVFVCFVAVCGDCVLCVVTPSLCFHRKVYPYAEY